VPVVSSTRASLCVLTHETQFSVLAWGWSSLGVVSLMTRVSTFGLYTVGSESKGLIDRLGPVQTTALTHNRNRGLELDFEATG
jgi:hypothetical protein